MKQTNISPACAVEVSELTSKALRLMGGSASERAQAAILTAAAKSRREVGLSEREARELLAAGVLEDADTRPKDSEYRYRWDRYIRGNFHDQEMRDFLSGTQSILYTSGPGGGYAIPTSYDSELRTAMAQVDPILSSDVTSFIMTDRPTLQPRVVSGYDLSSIRAQVITEGSQQAMQATPAVLGGTLKSNIIFRSAFTTTFEFEQDVPGVVEKHITAAGTALARAVGTSALAGRGNGDINGIVRQLSSTVNNQTPGKIVLGDLNAIFFSIDRYYRSSPKCAWLMNDAVYKLLRNAVDSSNRPLLSVEDDREVLLGKPILISPSLAVPFSSLGVAGCILFGDLRAIVIHCSRPELRRVLESDLADVTKGESAWLSRARADALLFDPSGGSNPPICLATIS